MNDQSITAFYKWTANAGKFDELKAIYKNVFQEMHDNEPDTLSMKYYFDEEQRKQYKSATVTASSSAAAD